MLERAIFKFHCVCDLVVMCIDSHIQHIAPNAGPPGTGKTHTITAMIQAVGEGIIVTAPSNAAVANVALKVHSSSYYDLTRIVVFGQNCDESVRFLNPLHRSDSFYKFMKSYNELTDINAKDMKRKEFAHWLKLDPSQDSDISDLAQLCPFIDLEGPSGRKLYAAKLRSASVLFCTLNSAGSNILRNAVHGAFATFILDEAGQCPESGKALICSEELVSNTDESYY